MKLFGGVGRPDDHVIRCPDCHGDQPMFEVLGLRTFVIRGGKIVDELTGRRLACQQCGAVFSVGPHGVFRHHSDALPFIPQSRAPRPEDQPEAQAPMEPPRLPILPMPRRRPEA